MIRTVSAALPRFALFLLALIPVLTGGVILASMYFGLSNDFNQPTDIIRRDHYPLAVVGHIIGGTLMLMLGFIQFSSTLRRRWPALHRWSGRLLVAAGAYFAISGLVMNASPGAQADSVLYDTTQNVMAGVFLTVLFLGIRAIRQRRTADHRAWMIRSYAITLGVGTQTVILLPVFLLTGTPPQGLVPDLVVIAAWAVNLTVAEWVIRGPERRRSQAA
jgi:hypothetical protein